MSRNRGLDRRAFLRNAGTTALLGAVGARTALATEVGGLDFAPLSDEYDFDTVYDRVGSESIKWDRAIGLYGPDLQVGMGIADMDFQAAPCITRALAERCEHENWGYLHRTSKYAESVVQSCTCQPRSSGRWIAPSAARSV